MWRNIENFKDFEQKLFALAKLLRCYPFLKWGIFMSSFISPAAIEPGIAVGVFVGPSLTYTKTDVFSQNFVGQCKHIYSEDICRFAHFY